MSRRSYRLRSRDVETTDTDDDETVTPRTITHRRTLSNATNMTARSIKSSSTARDRKRRRRMVRQSLVGPQVHELTIEERAGMLIGVAGDCLVKTIRAGLDWNRRTWGECSKAWKGFRSLRQSYIFTADAPAIISFEDAVNDLRRHSRHDFIRLSDAIDRCNLATLAYVILRPDECWSMAETQTRTRKGKERAATESTKVTQRNEVLILAWESFWTILPEDVKSKEEALRLWLDFATQIFLTYRCPAIDPSTSRSENLPSMTSETFDRLFNSAAIITLGRWEMGFDEERASGISGMEQEVVERRWAKAAQRRKDELERSRAQKSLERHPYDVFRKAMMRFIDANFVRSGLANRETETPSELTYSKASSDIVNSKSSRRSGLRTYPARKIITRSSKYISEDSALDEKEDEDSLINERLLSEGEAETDDSIDHLPLKWDILAEAARELEDQLAGNATPRLFHLTPPRTSSFTPVPYRPTEETFSAEERDETESIEGIESQKVLGGSTPKAFRLSGQQPQTSRFNFALRQANAVRVDWDSQSQDEAGRRQRRERTDERTPAHESPQDESHPSLPTPESQPTPRAVVARLPRASHSPDSGVLRGDIGRRGVPRGSRTRHNAPMDTLPTASFTFDKGRQKEDSDVEMRDLLPDDLDNGVHEAESEATEEENDDYLMPGSSQLGYYDAVEALGSESTTSDGDDMDSLLPDATELGLQPSGIPETQLQEVVEEALGSEGAPEHDSLLDVTHSDQGLTAPPPLENTAFALQFNSEPAPETYGDDEPGPSTGRRSREIMPTSQRLLASARSFQTADTGFEMPDELEDEEDRALLIRDDPPAPTHATPRASNLKPQPAFLTPRQSFKRSPPTTPRGVRPELVDPYLLDADGSALQPDETYRIPANHTEPASRLHGRIGAQSTQYSRLSGKMRWTEVESLLLYRTVQKVPHDVLYPLRVVWYLHGEYGTLSHVLQWHNPQHMKDKMRTTVNVRVNNKRPVDGRARAFLPPTHPARVEYEEERHDYEEAVKARITAALAESADEEDQLVKTPVKRETKAKTGKRKRGKGQTRSKKRNVAIADDQDDTDEDEATALVSEQVDELEQQAADDDDLADFDYVHKGPITRGSRRKSLRNKPQAGATSARVIKRTSRKLKKGKQAETASVEPDSAGPSTGRRSNRFVPEVEVPVICRSRRSSVTQKEEEYPVPEPIEPENDDQTDLEEASQVDDAIDSALEDAVEGASEDATADVEESDIRHERAVRQALLRHRVYGMVRETA